jgi:hypothetical protein
MRGGASSDQLVAFGIDAAPRPRRCPTPVWDLLQEAKMSFDEMFLYGMGGFGLILAITLGLAGFIIYKAFRSK